MQLRTVLKHFIITSYQVIDKVFIIVFVFFGSSLFSQDSITQTIRGSVIDKDAQFPLIGVNIITYVGESLKGATTDVNGSFRIENLPIGKYQIKISYLGYEELLLNNIILSSAKEVVLDLEMEES